MATTQGAAMNETETITLTIQRNHISTLRRSLPEAFRRIDLDGPDAKALYDLLASIEAQLDGLPEETP